MVRRLNFREVWEQKNDKYKKRKNKVFCIICGFTEYEEKYSYCPKCNAKMFHENIE